MTTQSQLAKRIQSSGQKKILALDGGGIRGIISIEILAKVESLLKDNLGADDSFVLADYFDFVAGTSTGAIIGACISSGMSVGEIRDFYLGSGSVMFQRSWWSFYNYIRYGYQYSDANLVEKLKGTLGEETTLGSDRLKTVLMMVMRNAKTDSPWPVSNNPFAKYNQADIDGNNLELPLWHLIRASTAAPTFFPPESIDIGRNKFVFVDGAVTPYNNPALQAFVMATNNAYRMNWAVGKDKLLLVSVGTGSSTLHNKGISRLGEGLLNIIRQVPSALMNAASHQQDMLCRVLGDCRVGDVIDGEIGDLQGELGQGSVASKLFSYLRYNVELDKKTLDQLGCKDVLPSHIAKLDGVKYMLKMQKIGKAVAKQKVKSEHFYGFLD